MALINAETKIPQLLLDYVESRRTALAIPASTALPFYAGVRDSTKSMPCVVFYCESFEMKHSERMVLQVAVDYTADLAYAASADENATAAKVRSAVADVEAWKTWLLALSTGDREGWRITKTFVRSGSLVIDRDMGQRIRTTTLQIHAITSETTFPV